ncbi:MAG: hypothetical protein KJ734_08090, partial [Chloroflexi bacterium]|nr:hypothetical protein [Chloroflexota bacterium]
MKTNPVRNSLAVLAIVVALSAVSLPALANPAPRPLYQAGAPTVVSYQGQVLTGTPPTPYNGTGHFKFAVVNAAGDTTYWSNDDTSSIGDEPTAAVSLPVSNGLFNVLLGDTALMDELPATAFDGTDRTLRVWFSTTGAVGSFTLLSPDRRIAAVPYALQAEEAKNAAAAGDADTLDGQHGSDYQNATNVNAGV